MGFMGTVGHFFLILAYQRAPASTLTPYLYAQIAFAMVGGWLDVLARAGRGVAGRHGADRRLRRRRRLADGARAARADRAGGVVAGRRSRLGRDYGFDRRVENAMNEETFNLSIRKFLKMVGVSSQREIEQAVAKAVAAGEAGRRSRRR